MLYLLFYILIQSCSIANIHNFCLFSNYLYKNILYMGLFGEVVKQVLTEDKVTDYIKKLISNNTDEFFKQYLKTKVADLPENLQEHFKQAAEHSYNVCIEHDLNLTQLFRLEFLNFFDISHGK